MKVEKDYFKTGIKYTAIISIVVFLLLKFNICTKHVKPIQNSNDKSTTIHSIDTVYVHSKDTFKIEKISVVQLYDTLYLPVYIDTAEVIKNYYTKKTIKRKLIDTNVEINLTDTLYQNNLYPGIATFDVKHSLIVKNTITTITKYPKLSIGIFSTFSKNISAGVCANLYKKQYSYGAGYDLVNRGLYLQFQKTIN